ncbi:MAG: hypothetical protein U0744_07830 [Gemmataceae bacterium]
MRSVLRVAWRQLSYHKMKLAVAAAGVVVAVMLMLVQLGIRQGAIDNSVAVARRITADLIVVSPRTKTIFQSSAFPRRLLFRIPGHPAIDRVQAAYMSQAKFRSPWDHQEFPISVYGVDPRDPMMDLQGCSPMPTNSNSPTAPSSIAAAERRSARWRSILKRLAR